MDFVFSKTFAVYIMTNKGNTVLYTGITDDLRRRVSEHKSKADPGSFTARYNLNKLVFYETTPDVMAAIRREKQIKNWHREWKFNLIDKANPEWRDLSEDWR
jgi:putative endonuclease